MCSSVVLFSKQDYKLAEILKFICRDNRCNLTFCRSIADLLYFAFSSMPEVIVHDDETIDFNYELYRDFKDCQKFDMPIYVLLTNDINKYEKIKDIIIVNKQECVEYLNTIIKNAKEKTFNALSVQRKLELNEKLNTYLKKLGITPKYLGFGYIKELVLNIVEDKRNLKSFNTKLYPQIASKYNTQVSNIERNVRNAINVAVESVGHNEIYNELKSQFNSNKKPSNKQFISFLVEKITY